MGRRIRHVNPKHSDAVLVLDSRYLRNVSDNAPLYVWPDISGQNSNAISSIGSSPVFKKNTANGFPSVQFSQSFLSFMSGSDASLPIENFTYIGTHKQDNYLGPIQYGSTFAYGTFSSTRAKSFLYGELLSTVDNSFGFSQYGAVTGIPFQTQKWTANVIQCSSSLYTNYSSDGQFHSATLTTNTLKTGRFFVGRYPPGDVNTNNSYLNGNIGAIYIFNKYLNIETTKRYWQSLAFSYKIELK